MTGLFLESVELSGISRWRGSQNSTLCGVALMLFLLFSSGDMQSVAMDMVAHFLLGSGNDYSNSNLTKAVLAYADTQRYISDTLGLFDLLLKQNNGNLLALMYTENNRDANPFVKLSQAGDSRMGYPIFNKFEDNFNGLGITIHEFTGHGFGLIEYATNGSQYSGVMRFTLWDNFGLDNDDFGITSALQGMRSWYILQHYAEYGGEYKPFRTVVTFDVSFSGTLK